MQRIPRSSRLALFLIPALLSAQAVLRFKTRDIQTDPAQIMVRIAGPPAGSREHMVLQFRESPTAATIAALERRGIHVLGDIPENGMLVSVARSANLRRLRAHYAAPIHPGDKISPLIAAAPSMSNGYFLVAFHPDHGMAGPIRIDAVAGASYILVMEDAGSLQIDLQVPAGDLELARGRIAWCAVDLARKRSWSETWSGPPYAVQFLPRGGMVFFVCFLETGLFGVERVTIAGEPGQVLAVPIRQGYQLSGRVRSNEDGALGGLEVELEIPGILPEIADQFCRSRVQASGEFRVFACDAARSAIRLLRGDVAIWSGSVEVAGEHLIELAR